MGQEPLLRNLIRVLGELNVRALVTTGPAIDPKKFVSRPNVVVREFVPHVDVMPKADLAITHAGHGTVIRALAAGVPMVCVPLGRDQYDVAARVAWRGAGVKASRKARPAALKRAIATVLESPRFRESSRKIAEAIASETAQNLAVRELEALGAQP